MALVLMLLERVYSGVAGLLTFVCIARAYGPEVSGDFAYATSALQLLVGFAMIASGPAIVPRMISRPDLARPIADAAFVVRFVWALLLLAIAIPLILWRLDGLRQTVTLVICSMVVILEPFTIGSVLSQARGRFGEIAAVRLLTATARLAIVLAGIQAQLPPVWLVLAWVGEHAVLATMQIRVLRWFHPTGLRLFVRHVNARALSSCFRFGIRFLPGLLAAQFYLRIDRIYLGEHLDRGVYGVYAAGMQFIDAWLIIPQVLGLVLGQRYLYGVSPDRSAGGLLRLCAAMAGVGICGGIVACQVGVVILPRMMGREFASLQQLLPWAFAFAAIYFLDYGLQLWLISLNAPTLVLAKWILASAVVVMLLVLLTPTWGAIAGPLALAAGIIVSDIAVSLVLRKTGSVRLLPARSA